jgi:uncharacterized protein YjeT (DUF2065 family)
MWETALTALGLLLVVEGLLPFASPDRWRRWFEQALQLTDGQLRFLGLGSIAVGCLLLSAFAG